MTRSAWNNRPSPPRELRPFAYGSAQRDVIATGQCAEEGCEKPTRGRRLCAMHSARKARRK